MVQTFSPDNPIFEFLKREDYTGFLEKEMEIRNELKYPPFSRIILVVVSAPEKLKAKNTSIKLKERIIESAAGKKIEMLGPAEAPLFKRGNLYRYQLLLKWEASEEPTHIYDSINNFAKTSKGVTVTLNVDPMNFL